MKKKKKHSFLERFPAGLHGNLSRISKQNVLYLFNPISFYLTSDCWALVFLAELLY